MNPRITGASSITNHTVFALADAPLFLFHLLEWMDVDYELDVDALNERWARPENIDSWSQLVIKHTADTVEVLTEAPPTGVWRMDGDERGTLLPLRHAPPRGRERERGFLPAHQQRRATTSTKARTSASSSPADA